MLYAFLKQKLFLLICFVHLSLSDTITGTYNEVTGDTRFKLVINTHVARVSFQIDDLEHTFLDVRFILDEGFMNVNIDQTNLNLISDPPKVNLVLAEIFQKAGGLLSQLSLLEFSVPRRSFEGDLVRIIRGNTRFEDAFALFHTLESTWSKWGWRKMKDSQYYILAAELAEMAQKSVTQLIVFSSYDRLVFSLEDSASTSNAGSSKV